MGLPFLPPPVRLVVGILAMDEGSMKAATDHLVAQFGAIDFILEPIPFRWTNYYQDELGAAPLRSIIAFESPIARETVPDIKLWTNHAEIVLSGTSEKRKVNLDPGYLTMGQFFLATTKDQRQRVYVRDGIFVEPTLYYENGTWMAFPWTYRDWQSEEYRVFFDEARRRFAYQRTTGRSWGSRSLKKT